MSLNARNGEYNYPGGQNVFSSSVWKGKRPFRAFVSREKLLAHMSALGFGGQLPEDFKLYNAGVLHELSCPAGAGISSAYHGSTFRVFGARYY